MILARLCDLLNFFIFHFLKMVKIFFQNSKSVPEVSLSVPGCADSGSTFKKLKVFH